MQKIRFLSAGIRNHIFLVGTGLLVLALYLYRLGSVPTAGLAAEETANIHAASSWHSLLSAPLFLPLNAVRWLFTTAFPAHINAASRVPSILLAVLSIMCLTYIVWRWYKQRTMYFGLAIIATSAWILHIGRIASNDIAYLAAVPLLLATHLLLYEYVEKKIVLYLVAAVFISLLYIPGLLWFVLASVIWQHKEIAEALRILSWPQRLLLGLLIVALLAPFIYGLTQNMDASYLLTWLGLPASLPSWQMPLKNLTAAILFIFVRTPADPSKWLGQLALLDAFLATAFIAGLVFYLGHIKAERTRLLLVYGSLGLLLCAAGGGVTRSILVPVIYLVAIGGIAYILHQWLQVFPRNPLARRLGIGLVCMAVALSCLYNLRHYFVAWPHNSQTRQVYSEHL
jgi:hypothetical protein